MIREIITTEIDFIIYNNTNNIIEYIDKYTWTYCQFGSSKLTDNYEIVKRCIRDHLNAYNKCNGCKHFEHHICGSIGKADFTFTGSNAYRQHILKHNFYYLLIVGVVL